MATTFDIDQPSKNYDNGSIRERYGAEFLALIVSRGEEPYLESVQNVPHDAAELYQFEDGTEVIQTNAGLVTEGNAGFAELKAACLG
jgi:hypothetical protein